MIELPKYIGTVNSNRLVSHIMVSLKHNIVFDDIQSPNIVLAGIIRLRVVEHNNTQPKGYYLYNDRKNSHLPRKRKRESVSVAAFRRCGR